MRLSIILTLLLSLFLVCSTLAQERETETISKTVLEEDVGDERVKVEVEIEKPVEETDLDDDDDDEETQTQTERGVKETIETEVETSSKTIQDDDDDEDTDEADNEDEDDTKSYFFEVILTIAFYLWIILLGVFIVRHLSLASDIPYLHMKYPSQLKTQ